MGIANALNNRPVRVIGFLIAFHAFIYSVGYITGAGGFNGTVLAVNFADRLSTESFGYALLITSVLLGFAYIRNNPKTIRVVTLIQAVVCGYASITYLVNGAWLLAIGVNPPWVIISLYVAYAFSNREAIIAYDQTDVAKRDTRNESKLYD